jgi:hypothetical protein
MINPNKNKSDRKCIWLKAAVVGGLWASIEIIIGSFLHNARVPMAGSTLAFFGTVLLIGFYQIWPERGLIIRAGLITAIMKSVSPSVIILGPMVGIMLEATLIELVILLFGRNFIGYLFAGILSVSSALFYKIISMLMFYGYDLIQVYVNIINYGLKQFNFREAPPVDILLVMLVFYTVMGSIASMLGVLSGQKAKMMEVAADQINFNKERQDDKELFGKTKPGNKLSLLLVNIIAIPIGLILVNSSYAILGHIFILSYIVLFSWIYRTSLRRLRKPIFWIQLLLIVLLSSIFWKDDSGAIGIFKPEGFYAGVEILIRALFVVVAFSGISVELKNEKVERFLLGNGMGLLYTSITIAFSALPAMIAMLPGSKQILSHPIRSLLLPLASANHWLSYFNSKFEHQEKITS